MCEVVAQPGRRNIGGRGAGIDAIPRHTNRCFVDVAGKDLHVQRQSRALALLVQQHGERVGLFAAGTAGQPDPDGSPVLPLLREERQNDFLLQTVKYFGVTEEASNADKQVAKQRLGFCW